MKIALIHKLSRNFESNFKWSEHDFVVFVGVDDVLKKNLWIIDKVDLILPTNCDKDQIIESTYNNKRIMIVNGILISRYNENFLRISEKMDKIESAKLKIDYYIYRDKTHFIIVDNILDLIMRRNKLKKFKKRNNSSYICVEFDQNTSSIK